MQCMVGVQSGRGGLSIDVHASAVHLFPCNTSFRDVEPQLGNFRAAAVLLKENTCSLFG